MSYSVSFPGGDVSYEFESSFGQQGYFNPENGIIITDSNIARLHEERFNGYRTIIVPGGEATKTLQHIDSVVNQLIGLEADRQTVLVGVGGGMVTDLTGFVAAIYMRGVSFCFVPTSLLGMVDASIGGKNGVNFGDYKNMLGTIRQPSFLLFDTEFLKTLPQQEWSNGLAEIIKYACIFDNELFEQLEQHDIDYYQHDQTALNALIRRCIDWKNKTVQEDELENGVRKLLNFGHTAGHAIEQKYDLPHGAAVAIGMVIACKISEKIAGLSPDITSRLIELLKRYKLPATLDFDADEIMNILKMDKKRTRSTIDYIVLEFLGHAAIRKLSLEDIREALNTFAHGSHNQPR
jgi:3-dehydroquinate synthase